MASLSQRRVTERSLSYCVALLWLCVALAAMGCKHRSHASKVEQHPIEPITSTRQERRTEWSAEELLRLAEKATFDYAVAFNYADSEYPEARVPCARAMAYRDGRVLARATVVKVFRDKEGWPIHYEIDEEHYSANGIHRAIYRARSSFKPWGDSAKKVSEAALLGRKEKEYFKTFPILMPSTVAACEKNARDRSLR